MVGIKRGRRSGEVTLIHYSIPTVRPVNAEHHPPKRFFPTGPERQTSLAVPGFSLTPKKEAINPTSMRFASPFPQLCPATVGMAPTSASANTSQSFVVPKPVSLSFSTTPRAPSERRCVAKVASLEEKTSNLYGLS